MNGFLLHPVLPRQLPPVLPSVENGSQKTRRKFVHRGIMALMRPRVSLGMSNLTRVIWFCQSVGQGL